MAKLSHTDKKGKASMVDVAAKPDETRIATASGFITLSPATVKLVRNNEIKKGDVITTAEIAGIQAAKRCPELIPLCHTLLISKVDVTCTLKKNGIEAGARVKCIGKTGVEMEALTAVSVALLTIYDMCKAVDKKMQIGEIRLIEKTKTPV